MCGEPVADRHYKRRELLDDKAVGEDGGWVAGVDLAKAALTSILTVSLRATVIAEA
jgi:hypothetical protein